MDDSFELPVTYNNHELLFPAQYLKLGYSYKIRVEIYGQAVLFEPDEERNWRALIDMEDLNKNKLDAGLLQAIIYALDKNLK